LLVWGIKNESRGDLEMTDLFEIAMSAAEKVDLVFSSGKRRRGFVALLVVLLAIYIFVPSPEVPVMVYPAENISGIGLTPPFWWERGVSPIQIISNLGLDPNSQINYEIFLGTGVDNLTAAVKFEEDGRKSTLNYNLTEPLLPGVIYYWQIKATNSLKKSSKGPVWKFSTRAVPTIVNFGTDRLIVNGGEPVRLTWSVANASNVKLNPLGEVPASGEMILYPQENATYVLIGSNFAGEARSVSSVVVIRPHILDFMESGWSTYEDGIGSKIEKVESIEGKVDNATKISYVLVKGGRVGIFKNVSKRAKSLVGTDGISFLYKSSDVSGSLKMILVNQEGCAFEILWQDPGVANIWTLFEAKYENFRSLGGCDVGLDPGKVASISFEVYDEVDWVSGSYSWLAIDDLQGICT